MNLKDIEKIVKMMEAHGLTQFKLQQDDTKLELKKGGDIDLDAVHRMMAASVPPQAVAVPQAVTEGGGTPQEPTAGLPSGVKEITSPMVGTFYVAPSPDADPLVSVGGTEVLVENGTPVQYGEPLFRVKTS